MDLVVVVKRGGAILSNRLMFDHGSRKKLNHFFKQISYGAFNEDGCRRVIKSYCIDSNVGGHTAEESAESIEIVINLLKILLPNVQHDSATSDSGGGAAIQHVFLKKR